MRIGTWIGGAVLVMLLAAPAWAQSSTANLLGSLGNFPQANKPIDLSNVVAPVPQSSGPFHLNNLFPSFSLAKFFPSLSRNPKPPSFTTSPFPAPSTFPSTKYPNSFQPTPPFFPKQ